MLNLEAVSFCASEPGAAFAAQARMFVKPQGTQTCLPRGAALQAGGRREKYCSCAAQAASYYAALPLRLPAPPAVKKTQEPRIAEEKDSTSAVNFLK